MQVLRDLLFAFRDSEKDKQASEKLHEKRFEEDMKRARLRCVPLHCG